MKNEDIDLEELWGGFTKTIEPSGKKNLKVFSYNQWVCYCDDHDSVEPLGISRGGNQMNELLMLYVELDLTMRLGMNGTEELWAISEP